MPPISLYSICSSLCVQFRPFRMAHCCGDEHEAQYVQRLPRCFMFIFSSTNLSFSTHFLIFFLEKLMFAFNFSVHVQHFLKPLRSIKTFQSGMWLRWRSWHGVRRTSTSMFFVQFWLLQSFILYRYFSSKIEKILSNFLPSISLYSLFFCFCVQSRHFKVECG